MKTFGMIKPDAAKRGIVENIIQDIRDAGLNVTTVAFTRLTREQAEEFYAEHSERPFYGELVDFMTSDNVVMLQIEGDDAVSRYRTLMGATDPADAEEGTLRAKYATSKGENAVHGSDSEESAERELAFLDRIVECQWNK